MFPVVDDVDEELLLLASVPAFKVREISRKQRK